MQRDKESARELVKTFYNSRGEMTLQPSQSGHYIYSFSHLSDANYNKVELKGPTIDQIVHPLASAIFAGTSGRDRVTINSCSENAVDVDVTLTVGIERRPGSHFSVIMIHRLTGHRAVESDSSTRWPTKVRDRVIFWY